MNEPEQDPALLAQWLLLAQRAERTGHYVLISHEGRFASLLVERERRLLHDCVDLARPEVLAVLRDSLAPRFAARTLARGIYFPVPLERSLAAGNRFEDAVHRFTYDLIQIDGAQRWWWRGAEVASRTRDFFIDHLRWEPELGRWLFEYKVHQGWWDKSYLEAQTTPLRAVQLEEGDGEAVLVLQTGRRVTADLASFRLDDDERLFVGGAGVGEVRLSEAVRFRLLKTVDEDLALLRVAGRTWSLAWPPKSVSPTPG
jgi:hypothetical protein